MASEKRAATYVARLAGPQRSAGMAVRESGSKANAVGITHRANAAVAL